MSRCRCHRDNDSGCLWTIVIFLLLLLIVRGGDRKHEAPRCRRSTDGGAPMSTGKPLPLAEARKCADLFRAHFVGMADRWIVAGSIRREKAEVGDIEHVVIPRFGEVVPPGGMFPERGNVLWNHLDQLVSIGGAFTKAVYGEGESFRWGERYRGVMFGGMKHEVFVADANNLGAILTIRTGPADLSRELVTALRSRGYYHMHEGYVRSLGDGAIRPCPTEEAFFELCGIPVVPPERRRPLFTARAS